MSNWPTVTGINNLIDRSNRANAARSKLSGFGDRFMRYGQQYSVNPGIVAAILQRESQLGADESYLPENLNNFGGITGTGDAGTEFYNDRYWAKYSSPEAGLEATFRLLRQPIYTNTGGEFDKVLDVYAPESDGNDRTDMWRIFNAVEDQLDIPIDPDTNIYNAPSGSSKTVTNVIKDIIRGVIPGGAAIVDTADKTNLDDKTYSYVRNHLWEWLVGDIVDEGEKVLKKIGYVAVGLLLLGFGVRYVIMP